MMIITSGILMASTRLSLIGLFPTKPNLESTYAPGAAIRITTTQVTREYIREFMKNTDTLLACHALT